MMTATDTNVAQLVDRYIATWNETDPLLRRESISLVWTEDGSYVDPLMRGDGREGIDAMIAGVQAQFSGLVMRLSGEIDAHNDRVRFAWELGPEGGEAVAGGVDFGVVADGKLRSITGFIDFAP